ncbi:DUF308 domain-containing protein [uncultured Ruminococcus sp.]|uniref:DUF308 domain-containing protein n=1 Tax=uncultured Ruminococcus sp. TaxID=165186 RepID=UPI00292E6842|nr:DUF308 domain-containing protein [uncultured Ruminococcus sp.]
MEKFKRLLPTILMILFEVVIGILLLIDGERFTGVIFVIFGVLMLVLGLISLIRTLLAARGGQVISSFALIMSIILITIGAFFTAASGSVLGVVGFIATIYGLILVISGVFKLADYLTLRAAGIGSGFAIFSVIISIVLGILIAFNPFGTAQIFWTVLGIMLIASAVLDIISLIIFGNAMKKADFTYVNVEYKDKDEK